MPSIYQLKPRFQALLRPVTRAFYSMGVTANQVTLGAALGSIAVASLVALYAEHTALFWLIPLWMFLRMALNAIDGMLAREFGQQSRLGAYLNELCDMVSDAALFLAFAAIAGVSAWLLVAVVLLSLLVEYAGVMGPLAGASRRYDGPMGKSDRAFVFGVIAAGVALGWLPAIWINGALAVVLALSLVTLINRIRGGLAEASSTTH
ncbi:CDP-alcohol phosphatidyltransferase family protein [Pseudomonas sp. Marseille-QA0892]